MIHRERSKVEAGGILRSLENPAFRLYFIGQAISMIGTWAQRVAMGWLAYRISGSIWLLGLLGFVSGISMLFVAPFGGALGDIYDRRRLIIITQGLMFLQALMLVCLSWLGQVNEWNLVCLAAILGVLSAVDTPVRQSIISKLVTNPQDTGNAVALNSLLMNSARIVGPGLASLLLTLTSETACFGLNAVSFLAMLWAMSKVQWTEERSTKPKPSLDFIWAGLTYARSNKPVLHALLFVGTVSLTVSQYVTLMPAVVSQLYGGGSMELGLLLSSGGAGAVLCALLLAANKTPRRLPTAAAAGACLSGAAFWALPLVPNQWAAASLMIVVGGGMLSAISSTNIWIQHLVQDDMRGRMLGLYVMAALGIQSVGSLLSGTLGTRLQLPTLLAINGFVCVAGAALYFRTRRPDQRSPA